MDLTTNCNYLKFQCQRYFHRNIQLQFLHTSSMIYTIFKSYSKQSWKLQTHFCGSYQRVNPVNQEKICLYDLTVNKKTFHVSIPGDQTWVTEMSDQSTNPWACPRALTSMWFAVLMHILKTNWLRTTVKVVLFVRFNFCVTWWIQKSCKFKLLTKIYKATYVSVQIWIPYIGCKCILLLNTSKSEPNKMLMTWNYGVLL